MVARRARTIGSIILMAAMPGMVAISNTVPPYMGQEPPGLVPKVFAPGLISAPNRFEHSICLSKDGRECYFTVRAADWSSSRIMATRLENGKWIQPVPFSFGNMCPSLADDDQTLYFIGGAKVWRVRRSQSGSRIQWQYQPEILPAPVNSPEPGWSCHISTLGNLWICSWRPGGLGRCDLWRIRSVDGRFTEAQNLRNLNTSGFDCYPVPGPNEAYIVFSSDRPGGLGRNDLYISFPDGQGSWTAPRNLGSPINSSDHDSSPYLSPDHKYLFFARETSTNADIYWVRVEAFLPDPNGPVLNVSTGKRFACIQAAVNDAESGQVIQVSPGTYKENLILPNLTLTIRSANAQDPAVVAGTTLAGDKESPVVKRLPGECIRTILGLTITGGAEDAVDSGAQLQLISCVIQGRRN